MQNSIDFKATAGNQWITRWLIWVWFMHVYATKLWWGDDDWGLLMWCENDKMPPPVAHQSQSEQPSAAAPAPPRMSSVLLVFNQNFQAGRTGDLRLMGLRVMLYDVVIFSRLHQLHRLHWEYFAWHGQCGWYMVEMFAGHSQRVE